MRLPSLYLLLGALVLASEAGAQERHEAVVGGTTISWLEAGRGSPLLLIHGFGESAVTWRPLLDPLASRYRVIVPDLPGHGYSGDLRGPFSFRDAASDIAALLDHLDLPETRAMGFSAGGMILLHLATSRPERLGSMVVIGAGPWIPEAARSFMRAMDPESVPMAELQSGELAQPDTARTRDLLRRFVALADDYADPSFTRPLLGTIRVPTLLVSGDLDPFFPPSLVQVLHEEIANSHLFVIPNHAHLPFPADEAGRRYFLSVILGFLDGAWDDPD